MEWRGFRSALPEGGSPFLEVSLCSFISSSLSEELDLNYPKPRKLAVELKVADPELMELFADARQELQASNFGYYMTDPVDQMDQFLNNVESVALPNYVGFLTFNSFSARENPFMGKEKQPEPALELKPYFEGTEKIKTLIEYIDKNYLYFKDFHLLEAMEN